MNTETDTVLELASVAGTLVLRSGGETSRAEDTVRHIFAAAGYPDSQMSCQPTAVYLTLIGEGIRITTVRRVGPRSIDLSALNSVNDVSRAFSENRISAVDALAELNRLEAADGKTTLKGAAFAAAAAAVSSAAFSVMYGGSANDAAAAACAAMIVSAVQSFLFRKGKGFIDQFIICMIGGAVIGALSVLAGEVLGFASTERIIVGAIMPLLPGLALTVSIRDTIVGDLVSGVARLAEVVMSGLALAGGMGAAMYAYMSLSGAAVAGGNGASDTMSALLLLKLLISGFVAAAFYQLLWNAPPKAVPAAAAVGTVSYAVYAALDIYGQKYFGYFSATLLAAVMSELLARKMKMPSTIFLFPGIVPLVPGMGVYETMLYFVRGQTEKALRLGAEVMICAALMAFAVAVEGAVSGRIKKPQSPEAARRK